MNQLQDVTLDRPQINNGVINSTNVWSSDISECNLQGHTLVQGTIVIEPTTQIMVGNSLIMTGEEFKRMVEVMNKFLKKKMPEEYI